MFETVKNYLADQAGKGADLQSTKVEAAQVLLTKKELGSKMTAKEKADLLKLLKN